MAAHAALVSVVAGALLGLSLAAPPGPMNAIIAEATVSRGWRAGVAAGLGAMAADACFFALALVGVAAAVRRVPALRDALLAAGGLLMLYFAYAAARRTRADAPEEGASADAGARSFGAAFAVALTNPYQITWWLTAGVALLDPDTVAVLGWSLPTTGALAVVGFFGGILAWVTAFPAALRLLGERGAGRWVGYASAALLAWFGVAFLAAAV